LEGKLVHHDDPFRSAHHVDDPRIEALLEPERPATDGDDAKTCRAQTSPLDGGVAPQRAEERYRVSGKRPSAEILDEHRPAADLHGRQAFAQPDPNLSGCMSRSVEPRDQEESG